MGQIEIVSRAAQKEDAGRIWPAGRRLHTPGLNDTVLVLIMGNIQDTPQE